MIYLDNAATTMKKPSQVLDAVIEAFQNMGNAGRGAHRATINASRMIYETRELLANLFGSEKPERFAFTSNATEALNIAIHGLLKPGDHVITTVCEHNSVLRPLYKMDGIEIGFLPLKGDTMEEKAQAILDYSKLEDLYQPNTKAVIVTHASNLTGNITDLREIKSFVKKHNLLLIVDAAQTAGILPIDVEEMGIDILCFSGHKGLMGPQGTGGIYVREGIELAPFIVGGSGIQSYSKEHPKQMPTALEAGTLNAHGIAGLHGALCFIKEIGIEKIYKREHDLMKRFLKGIQGAQGILYYGNSDLSKRIATATINFKGVDSGEVSDELMEEYQIAVRSGAHCAPLIHEAIGTKEQGAVRFSMSYFNTEEEIDRAVAAIYEMA